MLTILMNVIPLCQR